MGNRIAKHVINTASGLLEKSTYYVRDASGNVMGTYEHTVAQEALAFTCIERPIYGSSRIGMDVNAVQFVSAPAAHPGVRRLGEKLYELSNHLGNVLSVINDVKLPVNSSGTVISYTSVVVSAQDYSSFGVVLKGRSWSTEEYRYGFNGVDNEREIGLNFHFTEFRVLDSRIARWWSIDPLYEKFCWQSTYCGMDNSPVKLCDPTGLNTIYDQTKEKIDNSIEGCADITLTTAGLELFLSKNGYNKIDMEEGLYSVLKGSIYEAAFHTAFSNVQYTQYPVTTTEGKAVVDFVDNNTTTETWVNGATWMTAHLTFSSDYYEVKAYKSTIRLTRQLRREMKACAAETTTGPVVVVGGPPMPEMPVCNAADFDMANFTLVVLYQEYNSDIKCRVSRGVKKFAEELNINLCLVGGTYDACDNELGFLNRVVVFDAKPKIQGVNNKSIETKHSVVFNYSIAEILLHYLGVSNDTEAEIIENEGLSE